MTMVDNWIQPNDRDDESQWRRVVDSPVLDLCGADALRGCIGMFVCSSAVAFICMRLWLAFIANLDFLHRNHLGYLIFVPLVKDSLWHGTAEGGQTAGEINYLQEEKRSETKLTLTISWQKQNPLPFTIIVPTIPTSSRRLSSLPHLYIG